MTTKLPYLPLWVDDYRADTAGLSLEEHGAYLTLLMMAWRSPGCSLPNDDVRLARMLGIGPKKWAALKPSVMSFWTLSDGMWSQKRLIRERDNSIRRSELARSHASLGGKAKALKYNNPPLAGAIAGATAGAMPGALAGALLSQTPDSREERKEESSLRSESSDLTPKPSTEVTAPKTRKHPWPEDYAEVFWSAYPRRDNKKKAIGKLDLIHRSDTVAFADILAGIERLVECVDKEFYPHPTTWLNGERWNDELTKKAGNSSGSQVKSRRQQGDDIWMRDYIEDGLELYGDRATNEDADGGTSEGQPHDYAEFTDASQDHADAGGGSPRPFDLEAERALRRAAGYGGRRSDVANPVERDGANRPYGLRLVR